MNAVNNINRARLVSTFIELIRINSPSFEERKLGDILAGRLSSLGCNVEFQEYERSFNLIARKKGNNGAESSLLLSGHMDTIEPTVGIIYEVTDDLIRSTGKTVLGADDKSALAQIIEALTVIEENNIPHGDIEVVFTSAEERGLCGAKNIDYSLLKSRYGLVLDSGGEVGGIVIGAPTHYTYEMRITGRAAHAGIEPEKGVSAIRVAADIISKVPDGKIDENTTANIGTINGGTATNVVPGEVVLHGEVRSHEHARLLEIKKDIFETAGRTVAQWNAEIAIAGTEEYQAFKFSKNDSFLKFIESVFLSCELTPSLRITGGGSDANIFNARGIKTINISSGMRNVHSPQEYIMISDLCKGAKVVLQAIKDFSRFAMVK